MKEITSSLILSKKGNHGGCKKYKITMSKWHFSTITLYKKSKLILADGNNFVSNTVIW